MLYDGDLAADELFLNTCISTPQDVEYGRQLCA